MLATAQTAEGFVEEQSSWLADGIVAYNAHVDVGARWPPPRPEVAARYPDYAAYLLVADGLESGPSDADSERVLGEAERAARARLDGAAPDSLPEIRQWHDAFRGFGAKPNRTRCSVEALLRSRARSSGATTWT